MGVKAEGAEAKPRHGSCASNGLGLTWIWSQNRGYCKTLSSTDVISAHGYITFIIGYTAVILKQIMTPLELYCIANKNQIM